MLSWNELEQRFRELDEVLAFARIDVQWGSAGEDWSLAGPADPYTKSRFEALSRLAGDKLKTSRFPLIPSLNEILIETDLTVLWYKALRHTGRLRQRQTVRESDEAGNAVGQIFTGYIDRPADASATLCLELARLQEEEHVELSPKGSLFDSFELKPNIFGLGLNFNHILSKITEWWRHRRRPR
jgi:hypothetical protein